MVIINDVLISDDVFAKKFACNLEACKGACCWEGDYGAPLTKEEGNEITENMETVMEYLPEESKNYLKRNGAAKYYRGPAFLGTPLLKNKRCVYLMEEDENGISQCSIERGYKEGKLPMNKPISCHLYPIRIKKNEEQNFEAWNYDRWDICNPACKNGKEGNIKVYEFVKDAIIRHKGTSFYEDMIEYDKNKKPR